MSQSIEQEFTPMRLFRFVIPSVIMMAVMSLYTIVDGICISYFVGSNALSSTNIVYPVVSLLMAVGVMLATGGSAYVAMQLGEGKKQHAREAFSMIFVVGIVVSVVMAVFTFLLREKLCFWLGANELLLSDCIKYLCVLMAFAPACMLQSLYQSFLVTAGKPKLGMVLIIAAGVVNAVLDVVFMGVCGMGVEGAALATGIGQVIPAVVGTLFFLKKEGDLYFTRFTMEGKIILQSCGNGSSEMVSQLANAVITVLFNAILMRMEGADGVAAITIILYGQFLLSSIYLGFSFGVAPIFGYQLGAGKKDEIRRLYRMCAITIVVSAVIVTAVAAFGGNYIVRAFVSPGTRTYELASWGFFLFSFGYLFCGFNIFTSGLFTALSDGKRSAEVSFARTFGFILICLLVLPKVIGIDGVWLAIPLAEAATFLLSLFLTVKYLGRQYFRKNA